MGADLRMRYRLQNALFTLAFYPAFLPLSVSSLAPPHTGTPTEQAPLELARREEPATWGPCVPLLATSLAGGLAMGVGSEFIQSWLSVRPPFLLPRFRTDETGSSLTRSRDAIFADKGLRLEGRLCQSGGLCVRSGLVVLVLARRRDGRSSGARGGSYA